MGISSNDLAIYFFATIIAQHQDAVQESAAAEIASGGRRRLAMGHWEA
jgi:hypothetical protein